MIKNAIDRLIKSGLSEQQKADLNVILSSLGDELRLANQNTVRALQSQQLTELKLSVVTAGT